MTRHLIGGRTTDRLRLSWPFSTSEINSGYTTRVTQFGSTRVHTVLMTTRPDELDGALEQIGFLRTGMGLAPTMMWTTVFERLMDLI